MINTPKPETPSVVNTPKVLDFVTWDTNTTTFDTETRTWDEMGTNMENTTKPTSSSMTNTPKQ